MLIIVLRFLVVWGLPRCQDARGAVPAKSVLLMADGHVRREVLLRTAVSESELIEAG